MSENVHGPINPNTPAIQELPSDFHLQPLEVQRSAEMQSTVEAFGSSLDAFAQTIPEVEQDREPIRNAGIELIDTFGIKPELFESDYRGMIFTSISARLASLNAKEPTPTDRQEKEFIADATLLLSKNFTDEYQDVRESLDAEGNPNHLTEAGRKAIYDKYTDQEHSKAITEAIESGLLDDIKTAMGITEDNENPFRVRVLSIATETGGDLFGLSLKYPDMPENWKDLPYEERKKINDDDHRYITSGRDWENKLLERGKKMKHELGDDTVSPAWVTDINGEKQLCISLPLAEKILYKDDVTKEFKYYDEDYYERDVAILKHEYVHTQPGFIDPNLDLDFGITIEERRAEFFSGDKHGYSDVKQFMVDVALLTGVTVADMFEQPSQKGRDPVEMLEAFASTLGLKKVVELLAVAPKNYVAEQSNSVRKNMHEYIGGYDGLLQKIYQQKLAEGAGTGIQERIKGRVGLLLDRNYEFWTPDQYRSFRKYIAGTEFLADEFEQELIEQRKKMFAEKIKTINFH